MNTHILIPIEGWKKRIEDLKKISGEASEEMQSFYSSAISELLLLKELCNGKQISLDEKDIDIKDSTTDKHISKVFSDWTPYYREPFKAGYKQALKDLI